MVEFGLKFNNKGDIIMRIIKKDVKNMKKRLQLAECDIDLALEYKEVYPDFAKTHYNFSVDALNKIKEQHDNIVRIITDIKKAGKEIPQGMQEIYDYIHEEYIEYATTIRAKQEMFK